MIRLRNSETVDPEFLAIVERALNETLQRVSAKDVYVIQIDGWFDYKWHEFSGTVMHEISVWRYDLTLPPFHPSRVLKQMHFTRQSNSSYESSPAKPLHIAQPSDANLRRKVTDLSASAVFVWYSHLDHNSDRASLMIYTVAQGEARGWYVGFRKTHEWQLGQVKGVSRREIETILSAEPRNS